jgi:hypothetical protein
MTNEAIIKFIDSKGHATKALNIHFKTRSTITGLFVRGNDFQELQSKNFWRIVTSTNLGEYEKTKNMNLAKIFSGSEFTRLSEN